MNNLLEFYDPKDPYDIQYKYKNKDINTFNYILIVVKIHKDKNGHPLYDYSNTVYLGRRKYITVECIEHKCTFTQRADIHQDGRTGCKKCINDKVLLTKNLLLQNENEKYKNNIRMIKYLNKDPKTIKLISELIEIHKDINGNPIYDYSKVTYVNYRSKIIIKCIIHNIEFEQSVRFHLDGRSGCQPCINNKSKSNKLIKLNEENQQYMNNPEISKYKEKDPLTLNYIIKSILNPGNQDENGGAKYDYSKTVYKGSYYMCRT